MDLVVRQGDLSSRQAGAIVLGIFQGKGSSSAPATVDRTTRETITRLLRAGDFSGRPLETAVLYPSGTRARRVILVGLGLREELTVQRVREASGLAARRGRELGARTLATLAHGAGVGGITAEAAARAVAEGSVLGHYRFGAYRSEPQPLKRVEIVESDGASARRLRPAVDRGRRWAEATCLARDLAWSPGQDLTPVRLGERALEVARASGASARVLRTAELERLGMGAVLAVGRGSTNPPCFIVLERAGAGEERSTPRASSTATAKAKAARTAQATARRGARQGGTRRRPLVVIGKGVTFDTGGISLKPRENMHKMKYDMSGAAAVLGFFSALPTIEHDFPIVGLIPAAENMPSGGALKPGDVLRTLDGTTVEVTNTDAEGRLLLADALAYARRLEPEAVVDLATLTGAIGIALGPLGAGLFSADEPLAAELLSASAASGERLWRMPLWDDYRADLRSDTADLVNSAGTREGGAVIAAVFLEHFARGLPWAHLDIASTAWSPADRPYEPRGPTGFGVRLLLEWISRRSAGAPRPS